MALRRRTNAYWQKRSTERVALLERQSEPYIRKVNGIYADAQRDMVQQMKQVYSGYYTSQGWDKQALNSIAPTGDIKQFKAEMKPVKVWDGTAWVVKPLKRWNGTAWV